MPRLESTLLDKFVNGAFVGKRKIGRPLKYNIRHKGAQGWIELVFNPSTKVESYMSELLRFIHPYLFYVTYRFHVEKAREAGKFQTRVTPQTPSYLMSGLKSKLFSVRLLPTGTTVQSSQGTPNSPSSDCRVFPNARA